MHIRRFALLTATVLIVAACSGGDRASPTTAATDTPSASAGATRVEVTLMDTLRIEPAAMTFAAGTTVTFVVTNTGVLDHDFFIGDEAAQAEHEQEMQAMGGMGHDEPNGISVDPGETKELTISFAEPGETIAGCHVAGHYAAGMRAAITVTE